MREAYENLLKAFGWCAIILFAIRCAISLDSIMTDFSFYSLWGFAGEAIGVTIILIALYEKFLWKINPFESMPKLACRYKGIVKSTFDNIERPARLIIKQTLTTVHITLITKESKSQSLTTSIDEIFGEMQLTYCYLNTPKNEVRSRSDIHYGSATLSLSNLKKIEGHYYTDRKTTGDMIFIPEK